MSEFSQIEHGSHHAAADLLPLVYDELRKLAAVKLAQEQPGQTLDATALVHEAYLRLVDGSKSQHWNNRGHFFGAAARAMRRILVENARRKQSLREGGHLKRLDCDIDGLDTTRSHDETLAIDQALQDLEREEPRVAELVQLRYFVGLTLEEAAPLLGVSNRTAYRYWAYAKAWLHSRIVQNDKRGGVCEKT